MKKICSKCGIEKPTTEFYKDRRRSGGLRSWCKYCKNEQTREWQKANPEKVREKNCKWAENNPEKVRERTLKWRENNPEKVRAMNRVSLAKARTELADSYIKSRLIYQFGILTEEIDSEFIQDKRESIAVKREIRQLKKQLKLQQNG